MKFLRRLLASRVSIALAALAAGMLAVAVYPFALSDEGVWVDTYYMHYACGECYTQFRVERVGHTLAALKAAQPRRAGDDFSATPARYVGWDVVVLLQGASEWEGSYFGRNFEENRACGAPLFRLRGQFRRRLIHVLLYGGDRYDGIYFAADEGEAIYPNRTAACPHAAVVKL